MQQMQASNTQRGQACPPYARELGKLSESRKVRELSIVASPAYENTSFQPLGFYAAMNEAQWGAIIESLTKSGVLEPSPSQSSVSPDDNVGSKPAGLQEPETKTVQKAGEVKPMSVNAEQKASPQVAQATVNVAPGETSPKAGGIRGLHEAA
jgi:hypothetical protein